jgi:hypothetical protein
MNFGQMVAVRLVLISSISASVPAAATSPFADGAEALQRFCANETAMMRAIARRVAGVLRRRPFYDRSGLEQGGTHVY